jgi:hypothetical protein
VAWHDIVRTRIDFVKTRTWVGDRIRIVWLGRAGRMVLAGHDAHVRWFAAAMCGLATLRATYERMYRPFACSLHLFVGPKGPGVFVLA